MISNLPAKQSEESLLTGSRSMRLMRIFVGGGECDDLDVSRQDKVDRVNLMDLIRAFLASIIVLSYIHHRDYYRANFNYVSIILTLTESDINSNLATC